LHSAHEHGIVGLVSRTYLLERDFRRGRLEKAAISNYLHELGDLSSRWEELSMDARLVRLCRRGGPLGILPFYYM
jgi:hypothetical protein